MSARPAIVLAGALLVPATAAAAPTPDTPTGTHDRPATSGSFDDGLFSLDYQITGVDPDDDYGPYSHRGEVANDTVGLSGSISVDLTGGGACYVALTARIDVEPHDLIDAPLVTWPADLDDGIGDFVEGELVTLTFNLQVDIPTIIAALATHDGPTPTQINIRPWIHGRCGHTGTSAGAGAQGYYTLQIDPTTITPPTTQPATTPATTTTATNRPGPSGVLADTLPPGLVDSGIGFSDLYGEVIIIPPDDPDDEYTADLGSILPVGAIVETRHNSGAILQLRDMTTFVMKPNSRIRIGDQSDPENKLALLVGHIWVNVRQIMIDGSMDIEMSHGGSGVKGTTFELIDDGTTSTVMVYEGEVELHSHATGATQTVPPGHTLTATPTGLTELTTFDIDTTLATWDPDVQTLTRTAITNATTNPVTNPDTGTAWWIWAALLAGLALGLTLITIALTGRNRPGPSTAGATTPGT